MLDTIIIIVLGIIIIIQNMYIFDDLHEYHDKLDMFNELHKYHNELVSITEKYINKEIDIVEYNYLINNVDKCIKVLESKYEEDGE